MNHSFNLQTVLATTTPPNSHIFPESVLRLIFDYSIQGPVTLPPPLDDQRRALTQVCRDWRGIVVHTPTYWNLFTFVPWKVEPKDLFSLAESVFSHTDRDDIIPLSVSFRRSLQTDVGRNIFEHVIQPRSISLVQHHEGNTQDPFRTRSGSLSLLTSYRCCCNMRLERDHHFTHAAQGLHRPQRIPACPPPPRRDIACRERNPFRRFEAPVGSVDTTRPRTYLRSSIHAVESHGRMCTSRGWGVLG